MKITDRKLLRELYDVEAERKLLIGYRFKGSLSTTRSANGHLPGKRRCAGKGIADIFGRLETVAASNGHLRLFVRRSLAARLRYSAALLLYLRNESIFNP